MKKISTKQRLAGLKIRCNYGGAGSGRHKKDMSESEWEADTESRKKGIKTQLNDTLNSGLDIAFNKDLSNDDNFQEMKNYADYAVQGFYGSINNNNSFSDSEVEEAAYNTAESLKAMADEAKKAGRTDKEVNSMIQDSNRIANLAPSYYKTEDDITIRRNDDDDDTYRGSMGWG